MNKVTEKKYKSFIKYEVGSLISENLEEGRTAFWGMMKGYENYGVRLYLDTYACVVCAEDPHHTWGADATALVERFVDIEITELANQEA